MVEYVADSVLTCGRRPLTFSCVMALPFFRIILRKFIFSREISCFVTVSREVFSSDGCVLEPLTFGLIVSIAIFCASLLDIRFVPQKLLFPDRRRRRCLPSCSCSQPPVFILFRGSCSFSGFCAERVFALAFCAGSDHFNQGCPNALFSDVV